MSKFSVKKPFTVLVGVVIVIVLGIVAFTKMTPDLLPNLDMPYAIVMTTYPGASPEKVETTITKPMEQSLATLENIENIQSTSSENYSLIILEFTDKVNMDTVSVDILQKVDLLKGSWEDTVGTPYILKINPSMLPVEVAAADMEGMEITELSTFINDEILNKLEGTSGVANITVSGLVDETLNVVINQEKIDTLNKTISEAINDKFDESKSELDDAQAEIDNGKSKMESGKKQLDAAKTMLTEQLAQAEGQLDQKKVELIEGKLQIISAIQTMQESLSELETQEASLNEMNSRITELEKAQKDLQKAISSLEALQKQAPSVSAKCAEYEQQIASIKNNSSLSDEEKQEQINSITSDPEYLSAKADYARIQAQLSALGVGSVDDIPSSITAYNAQLTAANQALAIIDETLAGMNMSRGDVKNAVSELSSGKAALTEQIASMQTTLEQLESGEIQLNQAMQELSKQKTGATIDLSVSTAQLLSGQTALDSASKEIEAGFDAFDDAKEQALKGADLNNIITMDIVSSILTAQNFSMPAGYIEQDGIKYLVSVGDKLKSIDDMNDLMLMDLGLDNVEPVYLKDVADVFMTDNSDSTYAKLNGNNGVVLSFQKQSTYATATVSDNIAKKFEQLEKDYPGLHFTALMDQGDYIHMIIDSIISSLLWGALFAIIVLFLFLRDIRPTFITLCSIPISVLFAIALMYFSGVTLNMISMSGLAVSVGMLVDNSVVVIENIYRLRNKGVSPVKAAISGASQVAMAILGSTLTTVCVFLPIVFVEGLTRQLFTDMALTITYALLASLVVAMTLVPAMSSVMLKKTSYKQFKFEAKIYEIYEKLIRAALKHKAILLIACVVLLVVSGGLVIIKGFSFMPDMESPQISVSIEMPEDSALEDTKEMADRVMSTVQKIDGVDKVGAMLANGSLLSFGSEDTQSVQMYVMLKEDNKRSTRDIAKDIESYCADYACTVKANAESSLSSSASMLNGSGISIEVYGNDIDQLQKAAQKVADTLYTVKGTQDISNGIEETSPALRFTVNKDKAMAHNLTVAQVFMELSKAITTEQTSTTVDFDEGSYSIKISNGKENDVNLTYLKNYKITVTDREGKESEVAIKDIVDITETETLSSINRNDQKRYLTVTAAVAEGYNVTKVSSAANDALKDVSLGNGITYKITGENESIMSSIDDLVKMLLLGILLVYLVMVAQFQSLKSPFIVMFTIPLAFTGGFIALFICNMEISVISLIGFVMLCGIIVNNGIVLVDYINQLRIEGKAKTDAIVEAGITRLRPILITSLTTVLGLIVMALGIGSGSELMQPVAVVCIGGLLYATLMTLFVVPAIYDMFNRKDIRTISEEDLEITNE